MSTNDITGDKLVSRGTTSTYRDNYDLIFKTEPTTFPIKDEPKELSSIFQDRDSYKPFKYEWAYENFKEHEKMHWTSEEIPLHEDVKDWQTRLSDEEKHLIRNILLLFTQADVDVASGYYDKLIPLFPSPELRMMLGSFANREATHIDAYSLLTDTLGFSEDIYSEFKDYPVMSNKHDYIGRFNPDKYSPQEVAKTVAVYSGFTEGLHLFSSFAMLLNFQRFGKMKNMGVVVEWSIKDETKHIEGMTQVFRTLIQENPELWTDDFKLELYVIARDMVQLEDDFIDLAFDQGGIQGLTKEEMKQYIRYIADRRLMQLGLKANWKIETNPLPWIDELLGSVVHTNFFEARSTEYSKGGVKGDFSSLDFPKIKGNK